MEMIGNLFLNERGFFCDDQSIAYPVKDETIPGKIFIPLSLSLLTISVIILECFKIKSYRTTRSRCFSNKFQPILAGLAILLIYGIVFLIDLLIKLSVGELRPNFLDVCRPNWSDINCTDSNGNHQYIFPIPCSNETENWTLKKAQTSFPSGHATLSAFSVTVIIMYMYEMFPKTTLRVLVQIILSMFAFYMGISRVWDHMHHWWDVGAGFMFGIIWGYVVKKHVLGIWFPSDSKVNENGNTFTLVENERL